MRKIADIYTQKTLLNIKMDKPSKLWNTIKHMTPKWVVVNCWRIRGMGRVQAGKVITRICKDGYYDRRKSIAEE